MAVELPPYSGWRPRELRKGRGGAGKDAQSSSKRTRLSKAKADRVLYCSSKGHLHNPERYLELCAKADQINGMRRVDNA